MTEPRSLHRVAVASQTPTAISNDSIDGLICDITITLTHIKDLSNEFTHQSAEMLSALDQPSPELSAKRDAISAAWASAGALAERAEWWASQLEQIIGQARRGE